MDKREKHLLITHRKAVHNAEITKSEKTPTPSGKQFYNLFKTNLPIDYLNSWGFMKPFRLNKDIILYHALSIVLAVLLSGKYTVLDRTIIKAMNCKSMVALKDNEYTSIYHENNARLDMYKFLSYIFKKER